MVWGNMNLGLRRRCRADVIDEHVERTTYKQLSKSVHSTEVSGHTIEGRKKKFVDSGCPP